ncbi:hypothetical protein BFJ69_g15098 [Fusarium oxysporum]|uniref:Uncharacterized protein n=1 Tax=Fusarium oxysporum TaxID=5507 RepID=A0A420MFI8_FUSOX|nr:hypothetical protein BFJ69_g15098 [Fusarium oxysporum]
MRQPVETTNHQAEGSQTVDSATENVQTRPVNSSLTDTGEFEPNTISSGEPSIISSQEDYDLSAIDTGLDFYDEELVDAPNTEERQDQTEPGGPDVSAEMQASLPHDNTWNDLQYATHKFVQQYLVGIHSCGAQEHRESLAAHIEAEGTSNHHGIAYLFPRNVPHTLDKQHLLETETCGETSGLSSTQWQELFSGHTPGQFEGKPKQACLHAETSRPTPPGVSFDIDSILGFVTSPATAIHGIRFYSAPHYVQNISTDVHLTLGRLDPDPERPRLIPSRLKDVPHFIFARAEGADFITFHLFFPHLPCSRDFNRLQHLPASYRHALATCRAPQVENRLFEAPSRQAQLRMSYFLPPQGMRQLWDHVLTAVCQPGYQDFRDPELYMEAKGTKLFFKYPDAPSDLLEVMNSFDCKLHRILDFSHMRSDRLYIDVGKETCPMPDGVPSPEPQTYLWRRCCIRRHLGQLYDGNTPKSGQNFYHESMLRDAGGMTTLTPVRSRLRRGGILYGQMYSLTKEIVDAARTYPFQNPDLRHLALDPQLRNGMQSISGKPASGKNVTDRAYLASKRRCHYGLTDSKQRSFGVREEYRISWTLFQSVLAVLRSLAPEARCPQLRGPPSYLWAVRTPVFVDYVWHNINKFTTGFELVRAQCSGGLTAWEQTKMMDMFLQCLQVAVGGRDYSRQGALWWSRRELLQPAGLPRVYYGLGFSQTLEQYGYCWIEPRINWTLLRFLPDITDSVLFGNGTLHKRYLKYGGHVKHFFDLSRRADLGLEWLRRYPMEDAITDRIVSWLCHICLQQMRADVLHSIQSDLRPKVRTTILDDDVQFCRKGLSTALVDGMAAVSGNHANVKSPQEVAQTLFGFDDRRLRGHWENKPFRKLHQWIYTALQHMPAESMLLQAFARRLQCYLFAYHWVLPYPTTGGLAPRTKDGKRRWFSIDVQGEPGLTIEETSPESWYWARTRWRTGYPTPLPRYLCWSYDQWKSWVHRHIGQTLSYEVRELCYDQESFGFSLSDKPNGLRRNPLRALRDPVVQDPKKGHDDNSSITNSSDTDSETLALLMQQVIPSHLQPELEFLRPGFLCKDPVAVSNRQGPDTVQDIVSAITPETSPQVGNGEPDPVGHLARELAEQLLNFQGCCNECHQAAKRSHMEDTNEHISLATYLHFTPELGPDILGRETIAHQNDDLAGTLSPESRRQLFCGIDSRKEVPYICLDEDERVSDGAGVTFDIDSVVAFPSSLAVAKKGIHWSPTRMTVSDLQSDLHLQSMPVVFLDTNGKQHQVHRPIHHIPHYTFGRVIGFEDISLYLLFPNLYREEQKCSKLRDEDFRLWMDGILLPAIYQCYSTAHVQHYPSSYDHSRYNSIARGIEGLSQRVHPVAREQQLVYYLPPEALADVWATITTAIQEPGFQQFRDVTILLQAKNLKVLTKDVTWEKMMSRFEQYWTSAIDNSHMTTDLYFDIGKETCPQQPSEVVPWSQLATGIIDDPPEKRAETLLYRRCCLESYAFQVGNTHIDDQGTQKQVFYPFSMLQDTGSLTIETGKRSARRSAGLLYSQFYSSVKEVFAAGNVYPFTNTAIETLALDKKLRKTWELVGGRS